VENIVRVAARLMLIPSPDLDTLRQDGGEVMVAASGEIGG
jgi:hypothetical protein